MSSGDYLEQNADLMYEAILKLRTQDECKKFFEDVCTSKELSAMVQRYCVAKMLADDATYVEIVEETGASTATISRVKRSMEISGEGYNIVFTRLNEKRGRKKNI